MPSSDGGTLALDDLRRMGDHPADDLAAQLLRRNDGLDERELLRLVFRQIGSGTDASDDLVRAWMVDGPALPDWADPELIRRGQDFFGDWPLPIATALFCVSLPGAYAAATGAQVLTMTSDLASGNVVRRIAETGQMLFDVMDVGQESPDSLRPGGQGYVTVRGVRLLHGVVRQTLLCEAFVPQTCDETVALRWCRDWGVPVNQEDLLGTLLTFTAGALAGLDRLGIPYDPAAADAYLHTWCVIGHLLGIRADLLPLDRSQAEALALQIALRHHRRSPGGIRLMAALLEQMELAMPLGMAKLPRTLVRHMLPGEIADLLDVPAAAPWRPALGLMTRAGPLLGRLPGGAKLMEAPTALLGRSMLRMYMDRALHNEQPAFRLDATVVRQLSLHTSPVRQTLRSRRRTKRAAE